MRAAAESTRTTEPVWRLEPREQPLSVAQAESLNTPPAPTESSAGRAASISPLDLLHVLRTAGPGLFGQAELYGQLLHVEWAMEKRRLQQMLLLGVFGFSCWLIFLLLIFLSALLFSWPTAYRGVVIAGSIGLSALGFAYAGYRLHQLSKASQDSFLALREELANDLLLLRRQL